jgi:hypothetical protein
MNKTYTVRPDAPGVYVVVDAKTGAYVNRFHVPGTLVNGPIVGGDTCTLTTSQNGANTTYVMRLPSGHMFNRFVS